MLLHLTGKIIDNSVRQRSNWDESTAFVLPYRQVNFINEQVFMMDFVLEEPCTKRNKYTPTPGAVIFLSIFYNGSTVGYSRTIRRVLLSEMKVKELSTSVFRLNH